MKAVVWDRYGPPEVLRIEEVANPVPKDDEVLIRVRATTVNRSDNAYRAATPWFSRFFTGVRRPRWRISGSEFAGEVAEVGSMVKEFRPGDRAFGVNVRGLGAHAELLAVKESAPMAHMPTNVSFEEAASVCDGAILALNGLRAVELDGRRLLVFGATGSIGTAGVQLGKRFGAHVTAVGSTSHLELMRSLGPDEVIDRMTSDFTKTGERYDAIFDAVGKSSFAECRRSLTSDGAYLPTDGMINLLLAPATRLARGRRVRWTLPPRYRKADVEMLKEMIQAGTYRPVVDRTYPLEEIIEASRYVAAGHKTGNVVLTVGEAAATGGATLSP